MKKKIFLHVGTHKTGTTALQEFLTVNEAKLQESGVLVPTTGRLYQRSGHHNIAWELNEDARYCKKHGTLDDLCDEISRSDCPTIVISSEDFEYLYCQTAILANIKQRLNSIGCQVDVVIFLREWAEYANSLYAELLKHGLDLGLGRFIKTILAEGEFVMYDRWRFCFAYDKIIQGFSKVFGESRVQCKAYKRPIEPEFLHIIGLDDGTADFQPVSPANEMLSFAHILAILKFNKLAHCGELNENQRIAGIQEVLANEQTNSYKRPLISMCVARRLANRFLQTRNWLDMQCGVSIEPYDGKRFDRTRSPRWPGRKARLRIKSWPKRQVP